MNGLEATPFDEVVVCVALGATALVVVVLVEPGAGVLDPVVAPATPATVVVGVDVIGVVVLAAAAAVVTVLVVAGFEPEPPARLTSAAASTPNDSATTTASVAIRPFQ